MAQNHWRWFGKGAIALALVVFLGLFPGAAQTRRMPQAEPDFSRTGPRPPRTRGAGSRGCPGAQPLIPLVPQGNIRGGQTSSAYPTFWVSLPYRLTPTHSIRLELLNSEGRRVYQTTFSPPETPAGIISVTLPANAAPPLDVGKTYYWAVLVACDAVPDVRVLATGWVERVSLDPTVAHQIAAASPQERSDLYATQLLWYDALTVLAEERRMRSGDRSLTTRWNRLLSLPSVGLEALTTTPITPCCRLTP